MFRSFWMGGFEGSCHRYQGRQLDLVAASGHAAQVGVDYGLLAGAGVLTVRDAVRWHLVEAGVEAGGERDWSSWDPMVAAAGAAGVQVIWDLVHYGVPEGVDVWGAGFVERVAAFAGAAAGRLMGSVEGPRVWVPMNEISFWAWAGGDVAYLHPAAAGRGDELKRQLARAGIAAARAIRAVDPAARLVWPEPVIHIAGHPERPEEWAAAEAYRTAQYEAWDMVSGRLCPELGGAPELLDVVGVNFYFNNQWIHGAPPRGGETLALGHRSFRPFSAMLGEVYERYGRPVLVSETGAEGGAEGGNGPGWLRYVAGEVRDAGAAGVEVTGVCVYPVMDYPGWTDGRHCACGVIACDGDWAGRRMRPEMVGVLDEVRALGEGRASVAVRHRDHFVAVRQ